jgi:SAM-dependent methyltransferase
MKDILGMALLDYYNGNYTEDIITNTDISDDDEMPLPYLFRSYEEMPKLEKIALSKCSGKILDVGCGAGSHSLYLQSENFDVTAIDVSKGACEVAKARGVEKVVNSKIEEYSQEKFDTVLMLMNGIGLAGRLERLRPFLLNIFDKINENGSLLVDSSDISYMYEDEDGGMWIDFAKEYHGELEFVMKYKGESSDKFDWLYVDFEKLSQICDSINLKCDIIYQGDHFDYLARLSRK